MIQIVPNLANARLTATKNHLDSGSATALLQLWSDPRPAVGAPATGTLLATCLLSKPCGSVAGGVLTLEPGDDGLVLNTGTVTWARIIAADGSAAIDASVTAMSGSGEVRISSVALVAGGTARIVSAVFG